MVAVPYRFRGQRPFIRCNDGKSNPITRGRKEGSIL